MIHKKPKNTPARSPLVVYDAQVTASELSLDASQRRILESLDKLSGSFMEYFEGVSRGWLFRKFSKPPAGIYLWGDVGRGKSMLMDLFFEQIPIEEKRRIHFHAFMQEVHKRIHAARKAHIKDPLYKTALDIAQDCALLCLDEFQVTDVADAMILERLFSELIGQGVVVIFTSNRPPGELYKGGLQREKFLEFVTFLRRHVEVLELAGPQDYRMQQIRALKTTFFTPLGPSADRFLAQAFDGLIHHGKPEPRELDVNGRKITLKQAYADVLLTSFAELCEQMLGAADYLEIAENFNTVLLAGIPQLSPEKRNEARRFVVLIDTLYDHKVKLICTAAAAPDKLYPEGDGSFEFQRTASRLAEMQSEKYISLK